MEKEDKKEDKKEVKKEVKLLTMKNGNIEKLVEFLDIPLHGIEARARNRFVTTLGKRLVYLGEERIRLLEEHAEKDKDDKPKMIDGGKKYDITPENLVKVTEELNIIYNEDFIIDILPSNSGDIKIVTKTILETTKTFDLADGATYDALAKAFEDIK